ncbi:MAG: ribosome maturation factor RimM [Flavisolibacter sp.]
MTDYIKAGRIVASFGLKGELIIKHNLGKKTLLKGLKALFIEEKKESFIPWFIESVKIKGADELIIKLEGISSKEEAGKLTQKDIWVPESDFKKYSISSSPVNLLGFIIIEEDKELGKIIEVIEQPHQLLCTIVLNDKEVYIPLHQETLKKIDRKKKQVIVELPPGLLEIYQ